MHVKATVEIEKHREEDPDRLDFWNCLEKSEALMKEIMLSLTSTFANLYKSCDKGKYKYMNFQLEWHCYCLLPHISDVDYDVQQQSDLARLQHRWIGW